MTLWRDRNLHIVFGVTLMAVLGVSSVAPALPRIAAVFDVSPQRTGLLLTVFTVPGVILTPLAGVLADRLGRRRVIVPSLWLFALAGAACVLATTFEQLLALRLLQGVGASALGALNAALLGDLYEGRARGVAMGMNMSVLSVGTAAYPGVGGALAEIGWRWPFALAVLAIPVALAVQLQLRNPEPQSDQTLRQYLRAIVRRVWRPPVGASFTVSLVIFVLLYGAVLTWLPLLLDHRYGLSPGLIGLYLTASSAATGLVSAVAGPLAARWGERWLIALAFVLFAAALASVVWLDHPVALALPVLLYGTGMGLSMPSLMTILTGLAPAEERGAFLALNGTVLRLGQTLGPVLAGVAYGLGSMTTPFWTSALLAVVTLLVVVPFVPARAASNTGREFPRSAA
jgi:MFS family permease